MPGARTPRFSDSQRLRLKRAQQRRVIRLPGRLSAAWIWASLATALLILASGVIYFLLIYHS